MATLTLNGQSYNVDLEPLKETLIMGAVDLIDSKTSGGIKEEILHTAVKKACEMGMGMLGLVKQDRNDDPILIMLGHIIELGFNHIEQNGFVLKGEKIIEEVVEAIEPEVLEAPKEAPNDEQN